MVMLVRQWQWQWQAQWHLSMTIVMTAKSQALKRCVYVVKL
jgi:hypothetical protein